ncbi:hypothetical protein GCM10017788_35130 [Amycolatopsis acidiphila]|nr:hypothetical protein GCM10017788_35130 [Amycolatopsis acidiphila]
MAAIPLFAGRTAGMAEEIGAKVLQVVPKKGADLHRSHGRAAGDLLAVVE